MPRRPSNWSELSRSRAIRSVSSDIAWVDAGNKEILPVRMGRIWASISSMPRTTCTWAELPALPVPDNATPAPPNGQGPNGVLVTPSKKAWAGDASNPPPWQAADVDPELVKLPGGSIRSISPGSPGRCGAHCDRADEMGYDPADHVLLVANNQPLAATSTTPPTRGNPLRDAHQYGYFIRCWGHVSFEGATGLDK